MSDSKDAQSECEGPLVITITTSPPALPTSYSITSSVTQAASASIEPSNPLSAAAIQHGPLIPVLPLNSFTSSTGRPLIPPPSTPPYPVADVGVTGSLRAQLLSLSSGTASLGQPSLGRQPSRHTAAKSTSTYTSPIASDIVEFVGVYAFPASTTSSTQYTTSGPTAVTLTTFVQVSIDSPKETKTVIS